MSKSLYVHFSTSRAHGGSFQYDLNVLEAVLTLASEGVPLVIGYEHREWEKLIPRHITHIWVPRPKWADILFKGLTLARVPVGLMRGLFRLIHPAHRSVCASPSAGKFFTSQECQLSYLAPGPTQGVVHDLMHRYETSFPEAASAIRRMYRDRHFNHLAKTVNGICVDSELGRRQLSESYQVPLQNIDVLPFTVPPYALDAVPGDFESRYRLPAKFLFYPAKSWKHKNHACILRAMGKLAPDIPDLHLVLVGAPGNAERDVDQLITELGLATRIQRFGYVEDRDMSGFYQRARALVMPSFFGPTNIPPLEAMHHGCPVLVADNYAMPDQCGEACIAFNPRDPEDLASAIKRIWTDDALALYLSEAGRKRSENFSRSRFVEVSTNILRRRLRLETSER